MNKNSRLVYSTEKGRIHEEIHPDFDCQKDQLISLRLDKNQGEVRLLPLLLGFAYPIKN